MRKFKLCAAAAALVGMGGCATPTMTLSTDGPVRKSTDTGIVKAFYDAENAARNSPSTDNAQTMLTRGLKLVAANCDEFFDTAGRHQTWIFVTRDFVGAVGTIGTSVLALHNASKMAVSNLALGTGVVYSGLDIYTKNFLFAADNVASVHELIKNALTEHEKGVMALAPFSYESATQHIFDNQRICTPAEILGMARDAIKNGRVQASVSGDASALPQLADNEVLLRIGLKLNPPGPITPEQAGAFWWLLRDFSSAADKKAIAVALADLPAAAQPVAADGTLVPGWPYAAEVGDQLDKLSPATKAKFKAAIKDASDAKKAVAAAAAAAQPASGAASGAIVVAAAPGPALVTVPKFGLAVPAAPQGTRVSVRVR